MALSKEVLKQRIAAARLLRGLSQEDLNDLFETDGLDKTAAGRIERGDLDMQRAHEDGFVRNLRVPRKWFTSEDVDALVGWHGVDHAAISDAISVSDNQAVVLGLADLRSEIEWLQDTFNQQLISQSSEEEADPPDPELRRELEEGSPSAGDDGRSDEGEDRPAEGGGA